ncbi:hypothetical protein [Amycolatopsis sp. NPDC004079]|uniref:hypothetical protein n=1 Tax=Amycolatopsis sp. NPDC004079 TaxID=3154549 RepID=UPI0033B7E910
MTTAQWFGDILSWRRGDDGWEARHGGKLHEIVKLSRRDADAQRTSPGWHLIHHEPGAAWCGPRLGRTLDRALRMAEAHILVPYPQWFAADGAPGFITAMTGGGGAWAKHRLVAYPDHERRCITAHRDDGADTVVGEIRPRFLLDGDPALEPVRILWTPKRAAGPFLAASMSWHTAAAGLARATDDLAAPAS